VAEEVNTLVRSQIIVVEPTSGSVAVLNAGPVGVAGPPGPIGPPGPPGSGGGGPATFPITEVDPDYTYNVETDPAATPSGVLRMILVDTVAGDLAASVVTGMDVAAQQARAALSTSTVDGEADVIALAKDDVSYVEFITDAQSTRLFVGAIDPNLYFTSILGLSAPKGSLYVDRLAAKVYINTDGADTWTELGASSGPDMTRTTVTKTTASLADAARELSTVTMGKTWMVSKIVANKACRIRLYTTTALRDADASRGVGVEPVGNVGCILDLTLSESVLTWYPVPNVIGSNDDSTITNAIPITIDNFSGSTGTVGVTFTFFVLEV
jgi:hypothetical protein